MADKLQNPEKELRFTRAGQAVPYWVAAAVLAATGLILVVGTPFRDNPMNPHPLWSLVPLVLAWLAARLAFRMTRHAYLILTPLGLEIFPLFRPEKTMRMVLWQEIQDAEVDAGLSRLTLHHDEQKTSGIHLSLAPIARGHRALLAKAISGRVSRA